MSELMFVFTQLNARLLMTKRAKAAIVEESSPTEAKGEQLAGGSDRLLLKYDCDREGGAGRDREC